MNEIKTLMKSNIQYSYLKENNYECNIYIAVIIYISPFYKLILTDYKFI